jgi:hypothetical protein
MRRSGSPERRATFKTMENEQQTIGEILEDDKIGCYGCGKNISDKKEAEVFVDPFFFRIFFGIFCSMECRDRYINSK